MENYLFLPVLVWLGILSWFDLRKNEIPHSAWVVIPLILAIIYRGLSGGWSLAVLAVVAAIVSEREWISKLLHVQGMAAIKFWVPFLLAALWWAVPANPIAGLAIPAFWAAWELGWWGGADAVSATVLCLIWPVNTFFLVFLACHVISVMGVMAFTHIKWRNFESHRLPGLLILFLVAICTSICLYI